MRCLRRRQNAARARVAPLIPMVPTGDARQDPPGSSWPDDPRISKSLSRTCRICSKPPTTLRSVSSFDLVTAPARDRAECPRAPPRYGPVAGGGPIPGRPGGWSSMTRPNTGLRAIAQRGNTCTHLVASHLNISSRSSSTNWIPNSSTRGGYLSTSLRSGTIARQNAGRLTAEAAFAKPAVPAPSRPPAARPLRHRLNLAGGRSPARCGQGRVLRPHRKNPVSLMKCLTRFPRQRPSAAPRKATTTPRHEIARASNVLPSPEKSGHAPNTYARNPPHNGTATRTIYSGTQG